MNVRGWQRFTGRFWGSIVDRAESEGRIVPVPHDPGLGVITAWDLGMGDATAIWFAQTAGKEIRLIDYYEASGEGLPHYANVLSRKGYTVHRSYCPTRCGC